MEGHRRAGAATFFLLVLSVLAAVAAGGGCRMADTADPGDRSGDSDSKIPDPAAGGGRRYLVRVAWSAPDSGGESESAAGFASRALVRDQADRLLREVGGIGSADSSVEPIRNDLFVVEFRESADVQSALHRLRNLREVVHVEPDAEAFAIGGPHHPGDPLIPQQWAHEVVRSAEAWGLSQGSRQVTVAVIDTGIDYTHGDLRDNMWVNPKEVAGNRRDDDGNGFVDDVYGWDFANGDSDPRADDQPSYHGTHVAGTIGAVGGNSAGGAGHALKVKLMALKFLRSDGRGNVSHAIQAIDYAIANGAKIMSNSWGSAQGSVELSNAIERARRAGILFVVAAGNGGADGVSDDNDRVPTYPAAYTHDNVLTVAATDQSDQLTRFSNYGVRTVHVGAPGLEILSTANGNTYQRLSGTSMATPLVSGVAALMMARRPDYTYAQIRRTLIEQVDKVSGLQGRVSSGGRVNAYKAVAALGGGTDPGPEPDPDPTPTPTPDPDPIPDPVTGIAGAPSIAGYAHFISRNPNLTIPIDHQLTEFQSAGGTMAYLEISQPNRGFLIPNGNQPDPFRLVYWISPGLQNRSFLTPIRHLPGWGVYRIRVIPLDGARMPVGRFSNESILELRPF